MKKITCFIISMLFISSCSSEFKAKPQQSKQHLSPGEFKSKQFKISDDEHVTVFDMPDNLLGSRCWVWVNEKINTSHMKCDNKLGNEEL